jgi:hypothetical protein
MSKYTELSSNAGDTSLENGAFGKYALDELNGDEF